jgi:nucleotide-binding universal stress UspA family protein
MRILVAIDLAVSGHDWLIGRANDWAGHLKAMLDIVYVRRADVSLAEIDNYHAQLQMLLDKVEHDRRGIPRCVVGTADDILVQLSSEYEVLVVGPREPGALERMLRGTMAVRILLRAHCPILIPRAEKWSDSGTPKILVAVDIHGPNQDKVVEYAARWTQTLGGRLDAVYAVAESIPHIKDDKIRARAEQEWLAGHQGEVDAVEAILAGVSDEIRGDALLRRGQPEAALVAMSDRYDMVVLGNRERDGLTGFILGAVAQHVVRNSKCDVLTLPTADLG